LHFQQKRAAALLVGKCGGGTNWGGLAISMKLRRSQTNRLVQGSPVYAESITESFIVVSSLCNGFAHGTRWLHDQRRRQAGGNSLCGSAAGQGIRTSRLLPDGDAA
jgi:hypothetical protein